MSQIQSKQLWGRREFLSLMSGGMASLFPWSPRIGAMTTVPNFSFVVVSDTHLGRDDKTDAAELWGRAAKEIAAARGDLVLHLGDVVDGGREKQYDVYKDIRKSIGKTVHEIPGNHDQPSHFAKHIRAEIDTSYDHQGVRFILMNNSRFKEPAGFVSSAQLKWLRKQFEDAASKNLFIILAMHVPIHENRSPDPGYYVKPADGQIGLYDLFGQFKDRLLATFHGHFHCGLRGWDDHTPLHEIIFPSALFNVNFKIAERQAPGYNLPEFRPGYALVTIGRDGMTLKYQPVGVAEGATKVCALQQLKTGQ